MAILPGTKSEQVNFFSDRVNKWNDNAATIGLTSEEVAAFLTTRINPAAEALEAARIAREAAKDATLAADNAVALMMDDGRGLVSKIQATAKTSDDPNTVYVAASLPAPKPRTPRSEPPMPSDLDADPQRDGSVRLAWKGGIPGRGLYEVQRRLTPVDSAPTEWVFIGNAIERELTDTTIPGGTVGASYRVRGVNTAGPGAWSNDVGVSLAHRPSTPMLTLQSVIGREAA